MISRKQNNATEEWKLQSEFGADNSLIFNFGIHRIAFADPGRPEIIDNSHTDEERGDYLRPI